MKCENLDIEILNIIAIIKTLIFIMIILALVALIIWLIIDIVKTITGTDLNGSKLFQSMFKRIIAVAIIFIIPIIVDFGLSLASSGENTYALYYSCAESETIIELTENEALKALETFADSPNITNYNIAKNKINLIKDNKVREELTEKADAIYKAYINNDIPNNDN